MDPAHRAELESTIREHLARGEADAAATAALRGYGAELFGFLLALHKSRDEAGEVFSMFQEHLWKGLPAFNGASSFRTWAYTLARNASHRFRRGDGRRARRAVPWSEGVSAEVAAAIRTGTATYLQTTAKSRFATLRDSLADEDKAILVLRVDRGLDWTELARVLRGEGIEDDALKREAARLRKRFQLVKKQLRELGRRAGLLGDEQV